MKKLIVVVLTLLSINGFAQVVVTKPSGQQCFEIKTTSTLYDSVSLETKILAFSTFWKEANYNFVFFEGVNINWDSAPLLMLVADQH